MKTILLILISTVTFTAAAQTRGVKIGFIDMEYILQNVPDYAEANNQLELKAQKWKGDAEIKANEIAKLKEALKTEKVLLTKELIEEREEEIRFQEKELSDFQQKRFGPGGDLMIQKAVLVKPIQDQVFTAVQDISEAKKYDFIFDKSSDLTMLFAAKRHDISDQVVRAITRSERRNQLSKKELKAEEAREAKEDMIDENPALAERQKILDDKKAAREQLIADRKAAAEERKRINDEKRQKLIEEREAKRNGNTVKTDTEDTKDTPVTNASPETSGTTTTESATETTEDPRAAAAAARAQVLADRKKAADERRAKILADREAAKKAREEKTNSKPETTEDPKTE